MSEETLLGRVLPLRTVWVYLGEDLGTRKHFCCIRKIVKRRFFVDENLLVQTKGMSCTKQANGPTGQRA
jgi:hypothetical protein